MTAGRDLRKREIVEADIYWLTSSMDANMTILFLKICIRVGIRL